MERSLSCSLRMISILFTQSVCPFIVRKLARSSMSPSFTDYTAMHKTAGQRLEAGPLDTSLSTSTQPKCRCANFAPTSVSPILSGMTL
jgi:hypothetical protein